MFMRCKNQFAQFKLRIRSLKSKKFPKQFRGAFAVCLFLFSGDAMAQVGKMFSTEWLLKLPQIGNVEAGKNGDIAWLETAGADTNIFVARAPSYERELLWIQGDTGDPIDILGFGPEGEVVFLNGRVGFNPSHRAKGTRVKVMSVKEARQAPTVILDNVSPRFNSAIISPDNNELAYSEGGNVFIVDISLAKPEINLTFTTRGLIKELVFSPNGSRLAFTSNRANYNRGKYALAGVYDRTDRAVRYMHPGLGIDQDITWSPNGERVAFVRFGFEPRTWRFSNHRQGAPFDIIVASASTGEGESVFTSSPGYGSRFNGFGANGYWGTGGRNGVVWLENDKLLFPYEKTGWKHIYSVPANGGPAKQLTQGSYEVAGVAATADRKQLLFWSNSEDNLDRLKLSKMNMGGAIDDDSLPLIDDNSMPFFAIPLPGGAFVYESASSTTPRRLVVRTAYGKHKQLSTGPKTSDLVARNIPQPETIKFKVSDGLEISGVMYKPAHKKGSLQSHPAVVIAHGGPRSQAYPVWSGGTTRGLVRYHLINQGYYVLSVNYRSGTGYGLNFREPDSYGGRGAGDVQDIIAAAKHLIEHYPAVDPKRIGVYGHSYGGHLVTNALARSNIFTAGISSAGVGDWTVEMEKDFSEKLQFNIPERLKIEELATNSSAIAEINHWGNEPILFIHGDNDRQAAMQQSIELFHALRRRGVTAEALVLPGESHGFSRHASRLKMLRSVDSFFKKHLSVTAP